MLTPSQLLGPPEIFVVKRFFSSTADEGDCSAVEWILQPSQQLIDGEMEKERMDGGWIVGAGHLQDHTVSQLLESAKRTFPVIVKFYSFSVYGQTSSDYLVERSKEHKRSHAWFTFCCESNESRSTNKDIININELFPFSSRFKGCILIWSLIFEFEHFFMSTDNFLTSSSLSSTKWLC